MKKVLLQKEGNMQNEVKGLSLFNDITDEALRNRNRAVILTNVLESNLDRATMKVNLRGAELAVAYFEAIPEGDKADVQSRFLTEANHRGFKLT